MPFFLSVVLFVKNETVIGIMGKVQGITKASRPPIKPKKKIRHNPFEPSVPVPPKFATGALRSIAVLFISPLEAVESCNSPFSKRATPSFPTVNLNGVEMGLVNSSPLNAILTKLPETEQGNESIENSSVNTALPLKYRTETPNKSFF